MSKFLEIGPMGFRNIIKYFLGPMGFRNIIKDFSIHGLRHTLLEYSFRGHVYIFLNKAKGILKYQSTLLLLSLYQ